MSERCPYCSGSGYKEVVYPRSSHEEMMNGAFEGYTVFSVAECDRLSWSWDRGRTWLADLLRGRDAPLSAR